MKKASLILIFFIQNVVAQQIQFERFPLPPGEPNSFEYIYPYGSSAFADIDGDNDLDLLVTGHYDRPFSKLYLNDGNGNFSFRNNTPFPYLIYSSVVFADIDGDNDLDVLLSGKTGNNISFTGLYINVDGEGEYQRISTIFDNLSFDSIIFGDIDNDGDQDIYMSGYTYLNDGAGIFSLLSNPNLIEGVDSGSAEFGDVDGDNDLDLIVSGKNTHRNNVTKLYINDGTGYFMESFANSFPQVFSSDVAFADIDGDNDLDLIISGENIHEEKITKTYLNNGTGYFSELSNPMLINVSHSFINFADVDNDHDLDLIISGQYLDDGISNNSIIQLYINDGVGNFALQSNATYNGGSQVLFGDIDGDNDVDLYFSGYGLRRSRLYLNDGIGNFSEFMRGKYFNVSGQIASFADIDLDGDVDLLMDGSSDNSRLYQNQGNGIFNEITSIDLHISNSKFADIDNDSFPDLLISGTQGFNHEVRLYHNNAGTFSETNFTFSYPRGCNFDFADIDNDNDLDLFISGNDSHYNNYATLYKNDGNGNFTVYTNTNNFIQTTNSTIIFTDINNDNKPDLFISGKLEHSDSTVAKFYINDGNGNFTEISNNITSIKNGDVAFADIDDDNDLDFIISGEHYNNYGTPITKMYLNNGNGNFSESTNQSFMNYEHASLDFGDIDDDGDQDLIIVGQFYYYSNHIEIKLYTNDGSGNFELVKDTSFIEVLGTVKFIDIDGDNALDLFISGIFEEGFMGKNSAIYKNIGSQAQSIVESKEDSFTIYPNPSDGVFQIRTNNNKNINNLQVYNIQGVKVPYQFNPTTMQLALNLPNGIYIVKINIDDNVVTQKIVVK